MSYNRQTTIRCDYCPQFETVWGTVARARKRLKMVGWTFTNKKDKCPTCSKKDDPNQK